MRKIQEKWGYSSLWLFTGEGEKYATANKHEIREPAASYGSGILERIDNRDEKIAKQMDLMMFQISQMAQTIKRLEEKLEAVG
jgi:hypothetical protein